MERCASVFEAVQERGRCNYRTKGDCDAAAPDYQLEGCLVLLFVLAWTDTIQLRGERGVAERGGRGEGKRKERGKRGERNERDGEEKERRERERKRGR